MMLHCVVLILNVERECGYNHVEWGDVEVVAVVLGGRRCVDHL